MEAEARERHQWRRLPKMRLTRASAAAQVIDGKLYGIGGSKDNNPNYPGEFYDLKTQTWEPILPITPQDITTQVCGKFYDTNGLKMNICFVEIDNLLCKTSISNGKLKWRHPRCDSGWTKVKGLEQKLYTNHLTHVVNSGGGRRSSDSVVEVGGGVSPQM